MLLLKIFFQCMRYIVTESPKVVFETLPTWVMMQTDENWGFHTLLTSKR